MNKSEFPILDDPNLVYLDNAATTLKPKCVIDRVSKHYSSETANVHRGVHKLSQMATAAYEGARENISEFINARSQKEVVFTSGTTASINMVADSLSKTHLTQGDKVLITHMEHHSNIVPWQMACKATGATLEVVAIDDNGDLDWDDFLSKLDRSVKVVSVVHISNSIGTVNPVKKIIEEAKKVDALTLVDAAQSIQHTKVDVRDIQCDFLCFSGHKMYGPTGIGILYGREELLSQMEPTIGGGDMIRSVSFDKTIYAGLPSRFEAGTPNIAGAIGLGAAVDFINKVGLSAISEHEDEIYRYGKDELSSVNGLKWIGSSDRAKAVLSFVIDGVHPHDLGTLVDEKGVAIRTGHHCCEPVMRRFHVAATARASLSLYNSKEDINALKKALDYAIGVFS